MKPILIIRILQKIFQEGTGFRDWTFKKTHSYY
jgi:hypothetical protein